ncbi:MAG: hypothetical protein DCO96_04315 [Fluviicola sp. XM-24bin1]|nr:MAG: hypothetical protein DCO96_04315 [Fluviicola sp. XM-24bin1]
MSDKDQIKDLFSEKLGNFEAKVNPDLWANVASQVGASAGAAATGGMSLLTKAIIGVSGAAVITTGVVLYTNSDSENPQTKKDTTTTVSETSNDQQQVETPKTDDKTFVVDNGLPAVNDVNRNNKSQELQSEPTGNPDVNTASTNVPGENVNDPKGGNKTNVPADPSTAPVVTNPNESKTIMPILPDEKVTSEDEPVKATVVDIVETPEVREEIRVIMPNVFTPDGDRRNDEYFMKDRNVEFDSFEFVVYNNRGEEVYRTNDPDFRWDGRDQRSGEYVELQNRRGVFAYFITATTEDGRGFTTSNTITIQQ